MSPPPPSCLPKLPPLLLLVLLACVSMPTARQRGNDNSAGCVIHYYTDLPSKEPLVLHRGNATAQHWTLPQGDEDHLYLRRGEEVLVSCPGKHNSLVNLTTRPTSVIGRCTGKFSTNIEVTGNIYPIQDLACAKTSSGEILNKNTSCGPRNASLYEMGFHVREQWYPLITVCHVHQRSNTLYTEHILQGETEEKRRKRINRPDFDVGGNFYPGFSPNNAYRNSNTTLSELVGDSRIFDSPISKEIDRGHLSPDGDFILTPYRVLTYFYINTVPMWSSVNKGNWLLLENTLRKFAKSRSLDLKVTTGVYQVLKLKDDSQKEKQFFLYSTNSKKQMPVPKFLWKIVYNSRTRQGIAFVILNDPFVENIKASDKLCRNVCDALGWTRRDDRWRVISKGYMYCCDVRELRKTVDYIPKLVISANLRGPY